MRALVVVNCRVPHGLKPILALNSRWLWGRGWSAIEVSPSGRCRAGEFSFYNDFLSAAKDLLRL